MFIVLLYVLSEQLASISCLYFFELLQMFFIQCFRIPSVGVLIFYSIVLVLVIIMFWYLYLWLYFLSCSDLCPCVLVLVLVIIIFWSMPLCSSPSPCHYHILVYALVF